MEGSGDEPTEDFPGMDEEPSAPIGGVDFDKYFENREHEDDDDLAQLSSLVKTMENEKKSEKVQVKQPARGRGKSRGKQVAVKEPADEAEIALNIAPSTGNAKGKAAAKTLTSKKGAAQTSPKKAQAAAGRGGKAARGRGKAARGGKQGRGKATGGGDQQATLDGFAKKDELDEDDDTVLVHGSDSEEGGMEAEGEASVEEIERPSSQLTQDRLAMDRVLEEYRQERESSSRTEDALRDFKRLQKDKSVTTEESEFIKELEECEERLEKTLTINFFRLELIQTTPYQILKVKDMFISKAELAAEYLRSGILKRLAASWNDIDLSFVLDWLVQIICTHDAIETVDYAYDLFEHIIRNCPQAKWELSFAVFRRCVRNCFGFSPDTGDVDVMYEETLSASAATKRKHMDANAIHVPRNASSAKLSHIGGGGTHVEMNANLDSKNTETTTNKRALRVKRLKSDSQQQDSQTLFSGPDYDSDEEVVFVPVNPPEKKERLRQEQAKQTGSSKLTGLGTSDTTPIQSPSKPNSNNNSNSARGSPNSRREQDLGLTEHHTPVTAFPIHNFYYFVKLCRCVFEADLFDDTCARNEKPTKFTASPASPKSTFKFDQLVDMLYFAYTALLSVKLLAALNAPAGPVRLELEGLARALWRKIDTEEMDIAPLDTESLSSNNNYLLTVTRENPDTLISSKSTAKSNNRKMSSRNTNNNSNSNNSKAVSEEMEVDDGRNQYVQQQTNVSRAMHELVDKFSGFLSEYRYTMFGEMVHVTPHYFFAGTDISVRNHLALYILKNVVNQKINFPDKDRCLVPASNMDACFAELSAVMERFEKYRSDYPLKRDYVWQYCISVLFSNAFTFPIIPSFGRVLVSEADLVTLREMRRLLSIIEHWNGALRDMHSVEMNTKTKLYLLKLDLSTHVRDMDELHTDDTKAQIKKQTKQQGIGSYFSPQK